MKTYKIDPLKKQRPLMLFRGTRIPEVLPDSVAEKLIGSLNENSRGFVVGIDGEASFVDAQGNPTIMFGGEQAFVMFKESYYDGASSITWEDGNGQQNKIECNKVTKGAQYNGSDLYYTGPYKDLKNFVRNVIPYTGQPLNTANCRQWFSYTTPEGVSLTFRGCIQAQKQGGEYAGLSIDKIELGHSTVAGSTQDITEDLCITLDCTESVLLGMTNGMNFNVPADLNPGIGWLQIVATDEFKSHLKRFNEADGNADARIFPHFSYDGFTYNIAIGGIFTTPNDFRMPSNMASCRIKVKENSQLCNSVIGNQVGYAAEYFGYNMAHPINENTYSDISLANGASPVTVNAGSYPEKIVVIRFPDSINSEEYLHINIPETVTNLNPIRFVTMNGRKVGESGLQHGDNAVPIPAQNNMFAFFYFTDFQGTANITISRSTDSLTTIKDKAKNDINRSQLQWLVADDFDVVNLTGEAQEIAGSVRNESGKTNKLFVVPAGLGGFTTNCSCECFLLKKNDDNTYDKEVYVNTVLDVNKGDVGISFEKDNSIDMLLVPFTDAGSFKLTPLDAEYVSNKKSLITTANMNHDSADQLLTDVLAAVGNDRITAAFTHKVEGFDLSNSGDYIYVTAEDVKDRVLSGHAWLEIIDNSTGQYTHVRITDWIGDGIISIKEFLTRYWGINLENKSIFIAKADGDRCTLDEPPKAPGFYSADGQLIKAMTKEEVENSYTSNDYPSATNEAVKTATEFVWPAGITKVGYNAFSGCTGLTSVEIPEGVTTIEGCAFYGCSGLTSVTIPSTVTSIGVFAFQDCSSLTSVNIPEGVTSIGDYAFSGCSGLTSVAIPEGVTSISDYAFMSCTSLTSVTIPSTVTSIGNYAFSGCSGLTSVTIPSTVTSIGDYAFSICSGLNPLTVPSTVTTIGDNAFRGVPKVIYNGPATGSPWGATEVSTGGSTPEPGPNPGPNPEPDPEPEPTRDPGFYNAEGELIKAFAKEDVETDYTVSTTPANVDTTLQAATEFVWPAGVTRIGNYAFRKCKGLTSVTIPSGVTEIGKSAFSMCSGLTSLTINDGVTSLGESTFDGCTHLETVVLPNTLESIGLSTFQSCTALASINIPDSVTSLNNNAFSSCTSLNPLTVPSTVTTIGLNAFNHVPKVIYNGPATGSPWGAVEIAAS